MSRICRRTAYNTPQNTVAHQLPMAPSSCFYPISSMVGYCARGSIIPSQGHWVINYSRFKLIHVAYLEVSNVVNDARPKVLCLFRTSHRHRLVKAAMQENRAAFVFRLKVQSGAFAGTCSRTSRELLSCHSEQNLLRCRDFCLPSKHNSVIDRARSGIIHVLIMARRMLKILGLGWLAYEACDLPYVHTRSRAGRCPRDLSTSD